MTMKARLVFIPRRPSKKRKIKVMDASTSKTNRFERPPVVCLFQPYTGSLLPKLLIYFHGVGENMLEVDGEMKLLSRTLRANILVVEYPGYGLNWNEGICSE